MAKTLIEDDNIIGIFCGFNDLNLEFHADLLIPYKHYFDNMPLRGRFLLIELSNRNEALLGRITTVSSEGKMSSAVGEEYNLRAASEKRRIPEDVKEQYVRYRVDVRILGNLRMEDEKVIFSPSHRRLPHVGSNVAFPGDDVLKEISKGSANGTKIGHYSLGEYVYSGSDDMDERILDRMRPQDPIVPVFFSVDNLVSRRTFIFARAGYGKSNLNKLLFQRLFSGQHTIKKRDEKEVPVGAIIFDRDGEYFWPDDKGRPALCDVPELKEQIVLFTNRNAPSEFYRSFIAGNTKLDIRELSPSELFSVALSQGKNEGRNVEILKSLRMDIWADLVDAVDEEGMMISRDRLLDILRLPSDARGDVVEAAKSNVSSLINKLHSREGVLNKRIIEELRKGKLCIIDTSEMRDDVALLLSGILLRMVFKHNQTEFTKYDPQTIPTIVVLEEAQSVLKPGSSASEPFISWVKEGRKYDLGALMITQQPSSIPDDILSQGDNWFIFHLLSNSDLLNLNGANAHFSKDLLSTILNEPIIGQCIMWSSVENMSYPIPLLIDSFEKGIGKPDEKSGDDDTESDISSDGEMIICDAISKALRRSKDDEEFLKEIESGIAWGSLMSYLKDSCERTDVSKNYFYNAVESFMNDRFGPRNKKWTTYKKSGSTYVRLTDDDQ